MYLHIGKDFIINDKNIIGIFNIEFVKNTKEYKALFDNLNNEGKIEKITDQEKSFILVKENKKFKGYITNIATTTIGKRKM